MEPFGKKPAEKPEVFVKQKVPAPIDENILRQTWIWCLASFVAAFFITQKIYFVWFPLRFLKVFIHEIGHTVVMWLFGHFAIPAVNPFDTGGVAMSLSYTPGFCIFLLIVIAGVTIFYRKSRGVVLAGIEVMIVYSLFAFTPGKDWLISASGILGEYVGMGILLYICLFKKNLKINFERFLYGLLGWHMLIERLSFLFKLKADRAFYNTYVGGSSWQTGMIGDLAKIAFDINYRFSMNSFNTIVNIFIVLAFVPLIILAVIMVRRLKSRCL